MLSDKTKREQYDRFGTTGGPGGFPGGGSPFGGGGAGEGGGSPFGNINPEDLSDLFRHFGGVGGMGGGVQIDPEELFGGRRPRGSRTRRPAPPREVEAETTIPFETAANGGSIGLGIDGHELQVKVPAGVEEGNGCAWRDSRRAAATCTSGCTSNRTPISVAKGRTLFWKRRFPHRKRCWARRSTCRRWAARG